MSVIADNLKFLLLGAFPEAAVGGLLLTLILSVLMGLGSFSVGLVLASAMLLPWRPARLFGQAVSIAIRGVPSLVFLFWMYFLIPALLKIDISPIQSATIALSLYHGAYISEDIRGGVRAVGGGQWDAARAVGLGTLQVIRYVVLPQAIRAVVPALVNRYINLFLYTSVVSVVGVLEFTRASILVSNRVLIYPMQIFGFAALVYFVCCFAISQVGRHLERRWEWAPKIGSGPMAL